MRNWSKKYAGDARSAEDRIYDIGDLVLLFNSRYKEDCSVSRKLAYWWLGPLCRICWTDPTKGTYRSDELDEVEKAGTVAGRRLKNYHPRDPAGILAEYDVDQPINETQDEDQPNIQAEDEDSYVLISRAQAREITICTVHRSDLFLSIEIYSAVFCLHRNFCVRCVWSKLLPIGSKHCVPLSELQF